MNKIPHDYLLFVPIAMDLDLQNEELDQHLVGLCDWFTLLPTYHLLWLNSKKLSIQIPDVGNRRTLKSKVKSYKEQAGTRATCRETSERKEHTWWWLLCRNSPRWEFRPSHWQQEQSGLRPCPALTHTYTLVWQTETHVANTYKHTHIHTPMTNT